jgi:hypothetical protein
MICLHDVNKLKRMTTINSKIHILACQFFVHAICVVEKYFYYGLLFIYVIEFFFEKRTTLSYGGR